MKIVSLKINHITRPLGYLFETLTASYQVEEAEGVRQEAAQLLVALDADFREVVYDSGRSAQVSGLGTEIPLKLSARTRYYWKARVWDELGSMGESGVEWFETALMDQGFRAEVISPIQQDFAPVFFRSFSLEEAPENARLYISCLGVYEVFLNGERVGREQMAPGLTVYTDEISYQTCDVGRYLRQGQNRIEVSAGDGWYKGKYGYRQNADYAKDKEFVLLAELYCGGRLVFMSDSSWKVRKNKIVESDIYDGEVYDACLDDSETFGVKKSSVPKSLFRERSGVPVTVKEVLRPKAVLHTPAGETVLDMGQNMTGRVVFTCREERGTLVTLEHGEILQNGCFYNGNYRTAKARYQYISDGVEREAGARLTFFGFRYVKVTGIRQVRPEDFRGEVLYSDLESTGELRTGHALLNRLTENILWSQKGNFLDIPTDCPQRDEKMGWTGDAQIFAGTACLNMECYPFFRKYLRAIAAEQRHTGGLVPQIVPSVGRNERTSAAWGDAAVIIPWTLYQYYGDKSILKEQFDSMEQWLSYIDGQNARYGTSPDLWQNGFHYGDWLALDGGCYHMPTGGTECFYVSSAFFYRSADLTARAAAVLGRREEAERYAKKAEAIRLAILREYFTGSGRLLADTQTGYILALVFGIARGKLRERVCRDFLDRLRRDDYQLKTGFAGTPFLLEALSECGQDDLAYRMLLNEKLPGWLYPVTMGATTMWERWDAVNPDGSMSDSGMNSLNHYANGSVEEWMYCRMAGIRPAEDGAGFRRAVIQPAVSLRVGSARARLRTAAGLYGVSWSIKENASGGEMVELEIRIPFGASAEVRLPYVGGCVELMDGKNGERKAAAASEEGITVLTLTAGIRQITYPLAREAHIRYSLRDSVRELVSCPEIKDYLYQRIPMLEKVDGADIQRLTLPEMSRLPFFLGIGTRLGLEPEVLAETERFLSGIEKVEACDG